MGLKLFVRQNGVDYNPSTPSMLTKYNGEFRFVLTGIDSYLWSDLRVRSFWYHHFALPTDSSVGGFFNTSMTTLNWDGGIVDVTESYQNWKNDIYPPRVTNNKFCSEVSFYFKSANPTDAINPLQPNANDASFVLQGVYGADKYNNYYDTENSYSYISSPTFIQSPLNYLLEHKIWTKGVSNLSLIGNTLTIQTSTPHGLNLGDAVNLKVSFIAQDYNSNFRTTAIINANTFTVSIKAYTPIPNNFSAVIEYWVVLNGQAPSSAIAYNYNNSVYVNPNPNLDNHIDYTWLVYANKDTAITATNGVPDVINYATSSVIPIQNYTLGATYVKKGVFRFPVNAIGIPTASAPFYAEMNIQNWSMYSGNSIFKLYQMSSDLWNVNDTWNSINPYITSNSISSQTTNSSFSNQSLNTYMKFDVSNSIGSWLNDLMVPDVAMVKNSDTDFADTYWVTSSANTSPSVEEWPFVVVVGSSAPPDVTPPIVTLINASNSVDVFNIIGNGSGLITVQTASAHHLSNSEIVQITGTINYNDFSTAVTVINPTTFSYNQLGNIAVLVETTGVIIRSETVSCQARAADNVSMSTNPSNFMVKKSNSLITVPVSNITPIAITTIDFDFALSGIGDGYYQIQVKDAAGNSSAVITPPIITQYLKLTPSLNYEIFPAIFRQGDVLFNRGFNVESFASSFRLIMGDANDGGLIYGGINNSINDIDTNLNQFGIAIPSALSNEWILGDVDYTLNTIELLNSINIQVGLAIVFNINGNGIQPLEVGRIYYVKTVSYSGASTIVTLSETINGATVDLTPPVGTPGIIKAYNKYFTTHVEKDGISSASYSNILLIPIDDFAPFINLPFVSSPGDTVNVTISDPSGVDLSRLTVTNAIINGAPIDVYGDGTVIEINITSTSAGNLIVACADMAGNLGFVVQLVVSSIIPTISIINYQILSPTKFILTVKVFDNNVPAIVASSNSGFGIYVESVIPNIPYGTITSINSVSDGVVFILSVNSLGAGYMKIYARDLDDNSADITPPVLTDILPKCGQTGSIVAVKGVNLGFNPENFPTYEIIKSTISNTGFKLSVLAPADGIYLIAVKESINGRDFISNTFPFRVDNIPPTISINGLQVVSVVQFSGPYIDLGATASDNFVDLTSRIVTTGISGVNTSVIGNYVINYSVTDDCGLSNLISRTVRVVSGCELQIESIPNTGRVGDLISINATAGVFNADYTKNVVTFSGIIAEIISGTISSLDVIIPVGASTGVITVETFEGCGSANTNPADEFVVIYDDISFDTLQIEYTLNKRRSTTAETFSVFHPEVMTSPIYNIDYSYSYFTPIVDENSMVQNVISIVLTGVGERIFNPKFGTTLRNRLFNLVSNPDGIEFDILKEIKDAVARYESRVSILIPQSFVFWDGDYNDLRIVLAIGMPTGTVKKVGLSLKNFNNGGPL